MSSFGRLFRVTTFGESHCSGVGCIVEGVPPRMRLDAADIQTQLDRRKPGQSKLTTQRKESDRVRIVSGTEGGYTLGTPVTLMVDNEDYRPQVCSHHRILGRDSQHCGVIPYCASKHILPASVSCMFLHTRSYFQRVHPIHFFLPCY